MRSRSLVTKGSANQGAPRGDYTDGWCGVCGEKQFKADGGPSCPNGHGGAPTVDVAEGRKIREHVVVLAPAPDARLVSQELAEAIHDAEEADRPATATHVRSRGEVPLDSRVQRIVESVFVDDPDEVYAQLEKDLTEGGRTDHGSLMRALDRAETNFRRAHRLMITAKREVERCELENRPIYAAMREEANGALQREKEAKQRSKAITDADVEGMASIMFPDQYAAQQSRIRQRELTVKSLENLVDVWDSRCRSLQVLVGKSR